MILRRTIRARVELPCSVWLHGNDLGIVRGVTEELARESLVVIVKRYSGSKQLTDPKPLTDTHLADALWLKKGLAVLIFVELPCAGIGRPRLLQCAAVVTRVLPLPGGLRLVARIGRMKVTSRDPESLLRTRTGRHSQAAGVIHAVARPLNLPPVIQENHQNLTQSNSGENQMSFLKNLFVEEDGQDMVEYGLVIALVVMAAVALLTGFKTNIATAYTALGTNVTTNIK